MMDHAASRKNLRSCLGPSTIRWVASWESSRSVRRDIQAGHSCGKADDGAMRSSHDHGYQTYPETNIGIRMASWPSQQPTFLLEANPTPPNPHTMFGPALHHVAAVSFENSTGNHSPPLPGPGTDNLGSHTLSNHRIHLSRDSQSTMDTGYRGWEHAAPFGRASRAASEPPDAFVDIPDILISRETADIFRRIPQTRRRHVGPMDQLARMGPSPGDRCSGDSLMDALPTAVKLRQVRVRWAATWLALAGTGLAVGPPRPSFRVMCSKTSRDEKAACEVWLMMGLVWCSCAQVRLCEVVPGRCIRGRIVEGLGVGWTWAGCWPGRRRGGNVENGGASRRRPLSTRPREALSVLEPNLASTKICNLLE